MINRHGDVITLQLKTKISGDKAKTCTLALGEVTGHSHRFEEGAEFIPFVATREDHRSAHSEAFEAIKTQFKREFPNEKFPFTAGDFIVEGFVITTEPMATLVHEEHGALSYEEPGTHAVIIQRDYRPEGWRKVID